IDVVVAYRGANRAVAVGMDRVVGDGRGPGGRGRGGAAAAVVPYVYGGVAHGQPQVIGPTVAGDVGEADDSPVGVDTGRDGLSDGVPDPLGTAGASVAVHGDGAV